MNHIPPQNTTPETPETNETEQLPEEIDDTSLELEERPEMEAAPSDEKDGEEETPYRDGEVLKFVRIRFPGNAKSFPFLLGKRKLQYGQKVIAMSDRGMALGYINSFPYEVPFNKSMLPLRSISKVAKDLDVEKGETGQKREQEAEEICKRLITRYNLPMDLTHVEFTQFGKKAVFYFIAPQRVDFRDLVKDLVRELKMRIELRQISIRDRAAALGGIGPCGRELCCSSFLSKFGNVNIKMAKNQNLALNPTRLNGLCGQLKCCLAYEDEVYHEKRQLLPQEGEFILAANGDKGKVTKLHILIDQFEMLTDMGIFKRYAANQYQENLKLPESWSFPKEFDHIRHETMNVIGLVVPNLTAKNTSRTGASLEDEIEVLDRTLEQMNVEIDNEDLETDPGEGESSNRQNQTPRQVSSGPRHNQHRRPDNSQKYQDRDRREERGGGGKEFFSNDQGGRNRNQQNRNRNSQGNHNNRPPRPQNNQGPRKNNDGNEGN